MISKFKLIRNVGPFDNVTTGSALSFAKVSVVYAENGRGKTTLAALLRALSTGASAPVSERKRLGAAQAPHVIVEAHGGEPAARFEDGMWSRAMPEIAVFDDMFVDENVFSGLTVGFHHRQNLHELILGAEAIALGKELQGLVEKTEQHNSALHACESKIPVAMRGKHSVQAYCALEMNPNVDIEIHAAEQALGAARDKQLVWDGALFADVSLPALSVEEINGVLGRDLPDLDAKTLARVHSHLESLGDDGETWVFDGMGHLGLDHDPGVPGVCPFCGQELSGSPTIDSYRAYFSEAYESLKTDIADKIDDCAGAHGDTAIAIFERVVSQNSERSTFWSKYITTADVSVDLGQLTDAWRTAREAVQKALEVKRAAPLESTSLGADALKSIEGYEKRRAGVEAAHRNVAANNAAIESLQEDVETADTTKLQAERDELRVVKARHQDEAVALCDAYFGVVSAKKDTEALREAKKAVLDAYRLKVFPKYRAATNKYLERFNAGFRLGRMKAAATRGGAACAYSVVVNDTPLQVGAGVAPGEPSFRSVLSGGDRNTLALAFFLASLDADPDLSGRVVVIDDPVSSLDEHRSLTTVQEVLALAGRGAQVIVLSHSKPFLGELWTNADKDERTAIEVVRTASGSTFQEWPVSADRITEHDKRAERLEAFRESNVGDPRSIARDIRPHLEAYLRVACPRDFPPGGLIGPFLNVCRQRLGTQGEILAQQDVSELDAILAYANKYHHDTNPAWSTEAINGTALLGFVVRTLKFCRK